jgi:cobalt-zinc-cadmium resistance protein CzcA
MIEAIIRFSIRQKVLVFLFSGLIAGLGIYSLMHISIGAVPDVTNNQVQVITTSRNLSTQDVEQFITYPVELEMANLPGVMEIRSISKFGLSVVTIVFEDDMGTYLPRQLIAEKIKSAEEQIPAGFGKPFMGPISTGLGEIYQYILDTKPGYDTVYSAMEMRTIQDWIVRRQLSGIPGVVEVNSWGGYLKQYEVAIDPAQLRAMNLSVSQIYEALERNNSVSGGGYIEKVNEAYFIRGEGLASSIEDIESIVVDQRGGTPIYIREVGEVRFGSATRFGAITGNGEGEKVLGQVMMLKGANSNEVIERVKERVAEIQTTLPEGVYINGFLERSELIGRTTATIAENLLLGCLIVIFVVILLLGNWRSGLVVASVIPLSLLFALSLMYAFGVDANLMSLGAIDFGIIIDGAVIIVEFVAFQITKRSQELQGLNPQQRQTAMDGITLDAANRMMNSAVFGQLIIIIVFIPILSLAGVEGKMFRPMALAFCFALIGAMILCFTYVPALSALFLKPQAPGKRSLSTRLMQFLDQVYHPSIRWALGHQTVVLTLAGLLLLGSAVLFFRMGGEFVPTLDEGDFVIQPVLKTGTSLEQTILLTTKMERILKTFPEVNQVVSRIGAAEVPTDPMSMEESDVIITLHPRSEWTTAQSKDELAEAFKEKLSLLPGIEFEFTQPIEMRFNELITGVRADLAIKVFGEDLDQLYEYGQAISRLIANVDGAADITVEKTVGLPQMQVRYDRQKIARYGLNVADLNRVISLGFAGIPAGSIFEGEKRFDLVVRFEGAARQDLESLQTTSLPLPGGGQVPLSELADIRYTTGPAKISRDDTRRRIVVGVNVRGRDLESVVEDVQQRIDAELQLAPGYRITYGGQFENLRSARERLSLAVPIALVLIFVLLFFAFGSLKEALMVYSAIPLAAVGGVLMLWARDMPFSISAGVGFIALFGIAVLNGIVLIEHFKELKHKGTYDLKDLIIMGARQRLRPVLLTASAAAMGFLPMAISTSAGAEVQRPLATVVVGGLITATLLTLIVLPILYSLVEKRAAKLPTASPVAGLVLALLLIGPALVQAQTTPQLSLPQAQEMARANNASLQAALLQVEQQQVLRGTAVNLDKTNLYYLFDQANIARNDLPLHVWGVQQNFPFPTVFGTQKALREQAVQHQQLSYQWQAQVLDRQVAQAWYQVQYQLALQTEYAFLDSLYAQFSQAASRRYELGETNYLETLTAETRWQEWQLTRRQGTEALAVAYQQLYRWLQTDSSYEVVPQPLEALSLPPSPLSDHLGLTYLASVQQRNELTYQLRKRQRLPELGLEYFQGNNTGENAQLYQGVQVGLSVPIFSKAWNSQVQAAYLETQVWQQQQVDYQRRLQSHYQELQAERRRHLKALEFYENDGKHLADELLHTAQAAFIQGEIDFFQYVQSLEQATRLKINHLRQLQQYNQTILDLTYLLPDL